LPAGKFSVRRLAVSGVAENDDPTVPSHFFSTPLLFINTYTWHEKQHSRLKAGYQYHANRTLLYSARAL
jgi:hypothetical protein